jgi:hypothetical protein
MNDAHPTIKIRDLAKYQFSVKDYQRGYKWTIQQVLDLLEDINGFKSDNGGFYCLQPLALMCLSKEKKDFEKRYETSNGSSKHALATTCDKFNLGPTSVKKILKTYKQNKPATDAKLFEIIQMPPPSY